MSSALEPESQSVARTGEKGNHIIKINLLFAEQEPRGDEYVDISAFCDSFMALLTYDG